MKDIAYLSSCPNPTVASIDDRMLWQEVMSSMKILQFPQQEIDTIINVLSCVLLTGNLNFDESSFDNSNNPF